MITIGSSGVVGRTADGERQHVPVFFGGSRPGSTEDIVLAPAAGGYEVNMARLAATLPA
ncbi:hypothetical protein [Streptomyces sp. NPDC048419]|uniref:hypothetical protein n=1 Tax=Streptomyces sp. NPDC048419 TaxID=3365547 RepID=UPI00371D7829